MVWIAGFAVYAAAAAAFYHYIAVTAERDPEEAMLFSAIGQREDTLRAA